MKNLNILIATLIAFAIPAVAVGQEVSCDDCTHELSVYMGEGGFVASTDADEVTYVATCNGVTRSGQEMPNDDGTVSMAFTMANGLACHGDDKASFELGPVMDGGWFWIHDEMHSAVGNLVSQDILDNDTTMITDAGDGVTMTMGKGAVYLKETATGLVGILPNILPEPPMDPAAICGPRQARGWPYAWTGEARSSCMLGGGRTSIRLIGPGSHGATMAITNGMVYRPNAGTITVSADLWVDESGSYSIDESGTNGAPSTASIQKGWAGKTAVPGTGSRGSGENWLGATFGASVNATVGAPNVVAPPATDGSFAGAATAGVSQLNTGAVSIAPDRTTGGDSPQPNPAPVGVGVFTIGPDSAYCSRDNNHTAVVNIAATPTATPTDLTSGDTPPENTNRLHPAIATGEDAGLGRSSRVAAFAAITQLRVVCPPASSSANMGQDLVPENPFPVE